MYQTAINNNCFTDHIIAGTAGEKHRGACHIFPGANSP